MSGGDLDQVKLGENVVVGGLWVQIVFFSCFIVVATIFHARLLKNPTARSLSADVPWRKHLITLYVGSTLILVRSIFRVIEYLQGNDGYLLRREVFLYIFDSVLMLGTMVIFNVIHPSQITDVLNDKIPISPSGHSLGDIPSSYGGFAPVNTRAGSEERGGSYR